MGQHHPGAMTHLYAVIGSEGESDADANGLVSEARMMPAQHPTRIQFGDCLFCPAAADEGAIHGDEALVIEGHVVPPGTISAAFLHIPPASAARGSCQRR